MAGARDRSAAAQEASRRNGARSRGPRTAQGKSRSASNAIKHGLRAELPRALEHLPDWLTAMEEALRGLAAGDDLASRDLIYIALMASWRLQQTEAMIDELLARSFEPSTAKPVKFETLGEFTRDQVELALWRNRLRIESTLKTLDRLEPRIDQNANLRRLKLLLDYEKRFRGQRDRAFRKLLKRG